MLIECSYLKRGVNDMGRVAMMLKQSKLSLMKMLDHARGK
jgi:hypothetical protein